jgi:hypothetical protein
VLPRAVDADIDSVRITGYEASTDADDPFRYSPSSAAYGPVIRPKAEVYELTDVPVSVKFIRLDYLQDGSVRGVYLQVVTIQPGVPFEIVDPDYLDLAGLFTRIQVEGFSSSNDPYPNPEEPFYVVPTNFQDIQVRGYAAEGGEGVDLTSLAAIESTDEAVLRFEPAAGPSGWVIGRDGTATITARFIDLQDSLNVEVFNAPEPNLSRISVVQDGGEIVVGVPTQLSALGHFSDGSVVEITSTSEWTVPDDGESPERLSFDPNTPGLATGLSGPAAQFRVFYRPQRFGVLSGIRIVTPE